MSIHLQANANELKVSNCIEKCHTFTFEETYVGLCSFSWFLFFRNSVEIILPNQHTGGMLLSQGSLDGLSSVARSQRFVIIHFYYLRSKRKVFSLFRRYTKWSCFSFLFRWNEATLEERPEKVFGKVFVQPFQGNSHTEIDPFFVKSSLFYLFIWLILSLIRQTLFFHYSLFPSFNTLRQDTAILICPLKLMLLILLLNVSRRLDTSSIPLFIDRVSRVQLNNPNYTQSSTYQYSTPKATHCSYL